MVPTTQTPPAAWLAQGMAALDERFAQAQAEQYSIRALTDRQFAVTHGDGGSYDVDFTTTPTGVCTCPDFQSHGSLLHACRHTARIVLKQWPAAYARYQAKVRELATASLTAQAGAAEVAAELASPTAPPLPAAPHELIAAVVTATLSRAMTAVLDVLAAQTTTIMAAVVTELAAQRTPEQARPKEVGSS